LERQPVQPTAVFVRPAQDSPVQFVGVVSSETVLSAARRGFEPAIVQAVSPDQFAVWVRHAPVSPQQLPVLQSAARIAYGQSLEGPLRAFGPFATGERPIHVSARPYRRAEHLAESLAATRRATDKLADAQLKAHRVPPLPPKGKTRGRKKEHRAADRAWLQRALASRMSPRALVHVLARDGAGRPAAAVLSARYALSTLAAATPKAQVALVARSLSLPTSYFQALTKAVRIVRHFL
jgi:hypothetical protein